jgi:ABC-type amino acid transport substrate-binding protein
VIRAGYVVDSPWVTDGPAPGGVEPTLVQDLANSLGARVVWIKGAESKILKAVQVRDLDLAIGGFESDSPWSAEVAFTRPYYAEKHVLALPQGENAWLMRVEKHLSSRKASVPVMLRSVP